MKNDRSLPQLCKDEECTGCMACVNACNHCAITIISNSEGFYRPKIEGDKCIGCGLCEKSCPILNPVAASIYSPKVWAAWNRNEDIRADSSSGGVFSALADQVLDDGGMVFGAAYDEQMKVFHQKVCCKEDLSKLRKSKYVQSYIGVALRQVKDCLLQGTKVMFVGTPCQCGALRSFLSKPDNNLLLVDFICHGVPSPLFFDVYKKWLEDAYKDRIVDFNFRGKPKGWYDALRQVKTVSGKSFWLKGHEDCYWDGFNSNVILQNCCYNCRFLGFPRVSDITIADFWGIGKKIVFNEKEQVEKGVSLIVANNGLGRKQIESNPFLRLFERTYEEAIARNQAAIRSSPRPKFRDVVFKHLQTMDFEKFSKTYMKPSLKTKIVKYWREYFPAFLVKGVRNVLLK